MEISYELKIEIISALSFAIGYFRVHSEEPGNDGARKVLERFQKIVDRLIEG